MGFGESWLVGSCAAVEKVTGTLVPKKSNRVEIESNRIDWTCHRLVNGYLFIYFSTEILNNDLSFTYSQATTVCKVPRIFSVILHLLTKE